MSSRSQDAAKLAQLATKHEEVVSLLLRLTEFVKEVDTRLSATLSQLEALDEAHDDLERRFSQSLSS